MPSDEPVESRPSFAFLDVAPVWLVSDVVASCEELRALFDFAIHPYFEPPGEGVLYGIVDRGSTTLHLSRAVDRAGHPGRPFKEVHCDAYIYVDDVDAVHAQVLARGGTVLQPPRSMPYPIREMHVGLRDGFVLAVGEVLD